MGPRLQILVAGLLVALGSEAVPVLLEGGPFPDAAFRSPAAALQQTDPAGADVVGRRERYRLGLTLGGTTLAGITFEVRRGGWAAEATVGSITMRDVSLSVAGKRYFSGRTFQPFLGLGLWGIGASTEEGRGSALIARVPAGLDWKFVRRHSIGMELSLNRALTVNRMDPEDQDPPRTTLIPIPSIYYRYGLAP